MLTRRQFVQAVAAGIISAGAWGELAALGTLEAAAPGPPITAAEALRRLKEGNRRAAAGRLTIVDKLVSQRVRSAPSQRPFAVVLGCADSRVPVELVFDHGIGELFVIRVAGNTTGEIVEGSAEYAVEELHVPLIVVLGHQRCGAVAAALDSVRTGTEAPGHIDALLVPIRPVLRQIRPGPSQLEAAIEANVRAVVRALEEDEHLSEHVDSGRVRIVGAVYSVDTGRVEWLS